MNNKILFLVSIVFRLLPETRCFGLKRRLLKSAGVQIGEGSRICSSTRIMGSGQLFIGRNVWIGPEVLISCGSIVHIGDNVDIGPRVYIGTGSHMPHTDNFRAAGEGYNGNIMIGAGTWLCTSSVILPGNQANKTRHIGQNCIIGAGAVVTTDIRDGATAYGIPARERLQVNPIL